MATPPSPKMLEEQLDMVNFGGGDTSIQQIDVALHPNGSNFIELIMKSRIEPSMQPDIDHIIGSAIKSGKLTLPSIQDDKLNSAEAHVIAHSITQYAVNGQSRNEFTRILGGINSIVRDPLQLMRGKRKSYDSGVSEGGK